VRPSRTKAKGRIFFTFNVWGVADVEQQKLVRVVYWGRAKCFATNQGCEVQYTEENIINILISVKNTRSFWLTNDFEIIFYNFILISQVSNNNYT